MVREMKICPKCNSLNVKRVAVGIFSVIAPETLRSHEIPGGCLDDLTTPRWHCPDCKHAWGSDIEMIIESLEKEYSNDFLLA